ncbi:MAG: hypothetical protein IKY39_02670 [Clostridia bacterium]|nr:hypothetical protein [Clostridia bacterium]
MFRIGEAKRSAPDGVRVYAEWFLEVIMGNFNIPYTTEPSPCGKGSVVVVVYMIKG